MPRSSKGYISATKSQSFLGNMYQNVLLSATGKEVKAIFLLVIKIVLGNKLTCAK